MSGSLAFLHFVWWRKIAGRRRKRQREGGKERVVGEWAVRRFLPPGQWGVDSASREPV